MGIAVLGEAKVAASLFASRSNHCRRGSYASSRPGGGVAGSPVVAHNRTAQAFCGRHLGTMNTVSKIQQGRVVVRRGMAAAVCGVSDGCQVGDGNRRRYIRLAEHGMTVLAELQACPRCATNSWAARQCVPLSAVP